MEKNTNEQHQHDCNRMLQIVSEPIGAGKERTCYIHPDDPGKAIKISGTKTSKQTKREIKLYKSLLKRKDIQYAHLPKFYGTVKTNLGKGFVVDLIRDYDNEISKPLLWYLKQGYPITKFEPYLDEVKNYLINNLIIINHDLYEGNLLFQKLTKNKARLVIIDGIGDVVFIKWLNIFQSHVKSKIQRRWNYIINRLYGNTYIKKQLKALKANPGKYPKTLKPHY